jgi:spore maturation protein CgeB
VSNTPQLEANLSALSKANPVLLGRLLWPVEADHVDLKHEGGPTYRVHSEWQPLAQSEPACRAQLEQVALDTERVHLLGLGLGELTGSILETRPGTTVTVWERDPWLMRMALSTHDWSAALKAKRLVLRLGVDGCEHLQDVEGALCLQHPLLGQVYADERRVIENTRAGAAPKRWVALLAGGLFVDDLGEELALRGFGVCPVEARRWAVEELEHTLASLKPKLVVAVNYLGGLAELCASMGVKLAVWEIDPTPDRAPQLEGPSKHCVIHTYRAEHVELYSQAGFASVEHLFLAASPSKRCPQKLAPDLERPPLAFVGSSMFEQAQEFRALFLRAYCAAHADGEDARNKGEQQLEAVLTAQRQDTANYRIPELLEPFFGPFLAACDKAQTEQDPRIWVAEIAAAEKRLSVVANLGALGIQTWGDAGWKCVEPHGVQWKGPAGHATELTQIYNAARINIDINRIYQADIVTMRVFDVLACGGFLLAEHSADLERCFDVGTEVESYQTLAELQAKARHFLDHPKEAAKVAEAGRRAVLERHSMPQRLDSILAASGLS